MAMQARAEATRRKIIDSAVDLFSELGYGETGLADVLQRAGVSKGAFYYHFESKEAVAAAIIEEYSRKLIDAGRTSFDPEAPELANVIRTSFECAAIIQHDKTAWVGNELMQAVSQISSTAARIYQEWSVGYIEILRKSLAAAGLRDTIDPTEAAESIWATILGCHLLSGAIGDDRFTRLARAWHVMLGLMLPSGTSAGLIDVANEAAEGQRAAV